jgi:hypothetical protein
MKYPLTSRCVVSAESAASQRVKIDTSSPDGVACALICEHLDFVGLEGIVFPFVNAERRHVYKCEHLSMDQFSATVFDNAEERRYFAARATD